MTNDDLEIAIRTLGRRRPFRSYQIEFNSGDRVTVSHPEAVDRYGRLFLHRSPNRVHRIFNGEGVSQLIEPPHVSPES